MMDGMHLVAPFPWFGGKRWVTAAEIEARVAFYLRAMAEAAAALAAPDPELAKERRIIAEAQAAGA